MSGFQVVTPYRPFKPESDHHLTLGPFDWVGAIQMLRDSVRRSNGVETLTLTDVGTSLPVPALKFATKQKRLMLWILDVCLCYLASDAFDRDTVMVSPDCLVLGPLAPWFEADLGVVVRTEEKHRGSGRMVLNQVQFWSHAAKPMLVAFYQQALKIAKKLPDDVITWGADTVPIHQMLEPIEYGIGDRMGMRVYQIAWHQILEALTHEHIVQLEAGEAIRVSRPILDFRATRKRHMKMAYDALFPVVVV